MNSTGELINYILQNRFCAWTDVLQEYAGEFGKSRWYVLSPYAEVSLERLVDHFFRGLP